MIASVSPPRICADTGRSMATAVIAIATNKFVRTVKKRARIQTVVTASWLPEKVAANWIASPAQQMIATIAAAALGILSPENPALRPRQPDPIAKLAQAIDLPDAEVCLLARGD